MSQYIGRLGRRSTSSPARLRLHRRPRRVAMLSVHTSPLHQPGTGDAGGMNVYIVELAQRLAAHGIEVEIFTRATAAALPPTVELAPGVLVRHIDAGPYEGLNKEDLPAQLCAFTHGVMQAWAHHRPGHYDLVHSHYWLSGHVGWLAAQRWGVPLVHAMHTMAKVKNANLADGDTPEPAARVIGETQIVSAADRLIANTTEEADELVRHYAAETDKVAVVHPGVNLSRFSPAVEPRFRFRGADVVEILERVGRQHGLPKVIRVDQGTEFVSRDLDLWAYSRGVTLDFSRPGKPTDNAFIESFNGKLRAECLSAHWFMSLDDAKEKCEAWRRDYNPASQHPSVYVIEAKRFC